MKQKILYALAVSSFIFSPVILASGGGGFSSGSYAKKVDQYYELGKTYYQSSTINGSPIEYCVKDSDDLKKLSRRTAKQFKSKPASEFANSLYSCDDPSLKLADALGRDQGDAILYYLNKRYKLSLRNG